MIARVLPADTADAIERAVRALGSHRYVAGRLHLVHAFVFASLTEDPSEDLRDAVPWARAALVDSSIDPASRDERLWRRATDRELAAALAAFWREGDGASRARASLASRLRAIDVAPDEGAPFDEGREEDIFPLLVDAGWELLPLTALDPERHKGVIQAIGEGLPFEVAKFEEASAIDAPAYLQELPAIGPAELLRGTLDGTLLEPLTVWTEGPDAYHDYILRGVMRAAKLT